MSAGVSDVGSDPGGGTSKRRGFVMRRAEASDAQAIAAVFDAAVRDAWSYLGDRVQHPLFPAEYWDKLVVEHAPPHQLLVATDAAKSLVGFTAINANDGEIFLLFVDPAHGGRGVGRALLAAGHDALRTAGRTEAFLFTEERNLRARSVYGAAGYLADGTVRESDFQGVPLRELRLVKAL